ncbi:MAG: DUF4198 domain-containing protein [Litoreibacter sp.]
MRFMTFASSTCCALMLVIPAQAHEFWISPESFVIPPDAQVKADLRVGQNFSGSAYSFNPRSFDRFETLINGTQTTVEGRLGDLPALNIDAPEDGLMTIVYETTDSLLSYTEWEKFEKFANHKDFEDVLGEHVVRGLPKDERFVERYRRFGKSLVAVGSGAGSDAEVGLETEIVALANPYTFSSDTLPVKVLFQGKARPDVQVELFDKPPNGEVEVTLHRTDADGIAQIPVEPGHTYLVDSVVMLPLENNDPALGPVWSSLWASLTFKVPSSPLN